MSIKHVMKYICVMAGILMTEGCLVTKGPVIYNLSGSGLDVSVEENGKKLPEFELITGARAYLGGDGEINKVKCYNSSGSQVFLVECNTNTYLHADTIIAIGQSASKVSNSGANRR